MDTTQPIQPAPSAQQRAEIPEEIANFLRGILFDAKMITNDEKFNSLLVDELFARMIEFMNMKIVEELPEDALDGFNTLLEKNATQEEVDTYIGVSIPNVQKVYDAILLEFADMYIGRGKYKNILTSPAVTHVTESK